MNAQVDYCLVDFLCVSSSESDFKNTSTLFYVATHNTMSHVHRKVAYSLMPKDDFQIHMTNNDYVW